MEVFLPKILASSATPDTALMNFLEGHAKDGHEDAQNTTDMHDNHEDEHHEGHNELHSGEDPHIWLDPMLIVEVSAALAEELGNNYPQLKPYFMKNQQEFAATIKLLTDEFRVKFAQTEKRPIFTAHNAFSRLAERFNLHIRDFVTQSPEMRPGASHLQGLQNKIGAYPSICFIQETPTPSTYIEMITKGTDVKQVTIDILASDIQPDSRGYQNLIYGILSSIENCSRL